jgi:O-antigen/teichoic acid export membrane protein
MQVLYFLGGLGLHTAMQRQYERPRGEKDARRLLTLLIFSASIMVVLGLATTSLWSQPFGFDGHLSALRLAVCWSGASVITGGSLALLRSQDRLWAFAAVSLVQSLIAEATSLMFVTVGEPTATHFVLGRLLAQVAAMLLGLWLLTPMALRTVHLPLAASALRFGLPLVPAVLSTFVLDTADRLIVQGTMGAEAVASYQIAYNIGSMPMLLLSILSTMWMPRFFSNRLKHRLPLVLAASRDGLYELLVPVVIGLGAGAPLVLWMWAPPAYRSDDLVLVTVVVVVTAVPFAAQSAVGRALLAVGNTTLIAAATVMASIANVVLNLWLIPSLGLVGSALATFGSYWLLYALVSVLGRGAIAVAPSSGRLRMRIGMAVCVALASTVVPQNGAVLAARALIIVVTIVWFCCLLRGLSKADPKEWDLR